MTIEILLFLIGSLGLLIALISDIKTTEIPDYSNYFLIFSGFSLRILHSLISQDWNFTLIALKTFPIILALAFFMYYTKQWGGGDAKLLMGLGIIFATYPSFLQNIFHPKILFLQFPFVLFLNILLIGIIYSFLYSLVLVIKNKKKFLIKFKEKLKQNKNPQIALILTTLILIVTSRILNEQFISFVLLTAGLVSLFLFYFYFYVKTLETVCLIHTVPISKLREGDWITHNVYFNHKLIHKSSQDLTKKQITLIEKTNLKNIEIKKGIVFSPVFLISFVVSLIFGNIFLYFI
ncbi:MAG: hypothetical protein CMH63_03300 [Nanoarchaeota archaeon]|nr:hypothetical protein [Nanoarchaeota archaeon]